MVVWLGGGAATVATAWHLDSQSVAWRGVAVLAALSAVLFIPSWPWWRRNPVVWRGNEPPKTGSDSEGESDEDNDNDNDKAEPSSVTVTTSS